MTPVGKAASILSRFPGPVTLYPSRRKWLLVLLVGLVLGAGGVLMLRAGEWLGWLSLVFFAVVSLTALAAMLPGSSRLRLDKDGFEVRMLFRGSRKRGAETSEFGAAPIPPSGQVFVVFDDLTTTHKTLAGISTAIVGRNGALPDTFGLAAEDLAQLMTEWRRRALSS